jgi:predicted permease
MTYSDSGADVGSGDNVRRIRVLPISTDYFDVMRVLPALGHGFQPGDDAASTKVVVLSDAMWRADFRRDRAALGQTLVMSGQPYTIAGIMPSGYVDPVAGAIDAWIPMNLAPGRDPTNADDHYLSVIARLRPTVSIERAQAELSALATRLGVEYPDAKNSGARIYPLQEDIVGSSTEALTNMMGAVILVLILVCVNITNLVLVRGSDRARELTVRSALGASRARLVRQLLVESLTLAAAGAVAGIFVARIAISAIVALGSGTIPRLSNLSLNPALLAFSLVLATLCAIAFGLAPALKTTRAQAENTLHDQGRSAMSTRSAIRLREGLVVSQVAVAFVLVVGAGLLLASLRQLRQIDLGVRSADVLTFELNLPDARYDAAARARFYDEFAADLARLPGVRAAGGVSTLPATRHAYQWGVHATSGPLAGNATLGSSNAQNRVVAGDYFRAVGIPVLAGRTFGEEDDIAAPSRVIVSRSLARQLYPSIDPIGQTLETAGRKSTIVGVVGDVSLDNEGREGAYIYHPSRQFAHERNWALTQVVSTTGAPEALEPAARAALTARDPRLVMYRPASLDDAIGRGAAQRIFLLRLLATFAGFALALSALGLFGVLSYGVKLRSREFAVRLALGAARGAIGRGVLRRGLIVTAVGLTIGLAGAIGLAQLFRAELFHIDPLDTRVLVTATILLAVVGAIAAYVPAYRAMRVEPRASLQS